MCGIVEDVKCTVQFVEESLESKIYIKGNNTDLDYRTCRRKIIYFVIFPLLKLLHECYRLLDPILQITPLLRSSSGKGKENEEPPRGMLSIQNYTDIAAFFEFTVCTSIIPCLEDNTLTQIRDRAQHLLPRSIAGRIPRLSLLWGTENIGEVNNKQKIDELKDAVLILGQVVLLDRFRPMLLPRHLADLYAALFQVEHLEKTSPREEETTLNSNENIFVSFQELMFNNVDALNQAKAFQTLLLRGLKAPSWLRKKVSNLLTDLAVRDIRAIIQIFVKSASSSQEDMTGAALRLASALVSVNDEAFYGIICQNIVCLLDFQEDQARKDNFVLSLTAWAFVDMLPKKRLINHFLPAISNGLMETIISDSTHKTIRRIIALLSVVPILSHKTNSISMMLISCLPNVPGVNLLNQILRLVSSLTKEETKLKLDAALALRMACINISHASFGDKSLVAGPELLSIALLRSISPSDWDIAGFRYKLPLIEIAVQDGSKLESLKSRSVEASDILLVQDIEKRADVVINEVILSHGETNVDSAGNIFKNLPQIFFQHMLLIIFEVIPQGENQTLFSCLHTSVMVILPMLCDQCSQEKLLFGTKPNTTGILNTFEIIFDRAATLVDPLYQPSTEKISGKQFGLVGANRLLLHITGSSYHPNVKGRESNDQYFKEFLMSTASTVLSLLIAILELGSKQRNKQELALLTASIQPLHVLSSIVLIDNQIGVDLARLQAEVAEMASHAVVLIMSDVLTKQIEPTHKNPKQKTVEMVIKDAAQKLDSKQPAIRAEGVVKLRHLARACLEEGGEQLPNRPMIQEITEPLSVIADNLIILKKILRLAISTLRDTESYVYLAGIQTIVAIADVKPQSVLPIIIFAISTGVLKLNGISLTTKIDENDRVKLAEALFFIIRRRGKAINHYVTQLLGSMIYGNPKVEQLQSQSEVSVIQTQTHDYFMARAEDTNELTETPDHLDKRTLRVNTGGPLFEVELHDVLRSSCIFLVAEVVNFAFPSSISSYVSELVHLVISALHLEQSRSVRRAVSFLAACIYGAALREAEGEWDTKSLIIALVKSKEVAMKDVLIISMNQDPVSSKVHDPALSARCEEALNARTQLEEIEAFSVAAMYIEELNRDDGNPMVSIIKKRLNE